VEVEANAIFWILICQTTQLIISMGIVSLNIHVEICKIRIKNITIPIGNLNLFFNDKSLKTRFNIYVDIMCMHIINKWDKMAMHIPCFH
jgi:hypothetical protein